MDREEGVMKFHDFFYVECERSLFKFEGNIITLAQNFLESKFMPNLWKKITTSVDRGTSTKIISLLLTLSNLTEKFFHCFHT